MSDRPCNLCEYLRICSNAARDGKLVTTEADDGALGGVNVYVRYKSSELDREAHFVAWYMELPGECSC